MADAGLLDPAGRVVLVSGTSRGIGAAIARRLWDDGYSISLGARDPEASRAALGAGDESRVLHARFDATEPETAARWVAATAERFGRIDGLVNNAGILRPIDFETGEESLLDDMWAVNVKAVFRMIRLALPHLRRAGHGRIVNIASTDGKRFREASVSVGYTMTKHALMALSHAARFAGWEDGVRVTALCPGAVETDIIAGLPGVTPTAQRMDPATIAHLVAMVLALPDTASVAELPVNTRLESTI